LKQDLVQLEARDDGVYMMLSEGKECPSLALLLEFLKVNGISRFDNKSVETFVVFQGKKAFKIAERNQKLENDAAISVSLSKDHMEASVNITPPFFAKPWPTPEQIKDALARKNVVYGIDDKIISDIINNRICNESVVVAKGLKPIAGKDGRIDILIDMSCKTNKSHVEEKVDHRERGLIINVSKGDELAKYIPPTEGTDGVNVTNTAIKAKPGKDAIFPSGGGTVVSEDGSLLLAEIDGCFKKTDGKLTVSPEYNVSGDVDYNIGNISFVGAVRVKGAVRDGFQVVAGGDIEIFETVEGAYVESKGDILIKGGVRGMNKAKINAEGKIEIGFVDQAIISAGTDVLVSKAVLHSDISAGGSVIVAGGGKSQIAGGKIQATIEVSCSTLGSEMGTKTEVIVGLSPVYSLRKKELSELLITTKDNMEKIDANLSFLKKLESTQSLDETKRSLLVSTTKTKFQLQASHQSIVKEIEEIDKIIETTKSQAIVRVKSICYPGVSITMRGFTYLVREPLRFCSFVYDAGEIKLNAYDY